MSFDTMAAAQLAEGMIVAEDIGIRIAGESHLRNLSVTASTAIVCTLCEDAVLDNIHVVESVTALDVRRASVIQVLDSTLRGEILVPTDRFSSPSIVRIDNSSIGAITMEPGASVFIGSSKVTGPVVSGSGQLTCINVYNGNYQPIACD